MKYLDKRFSTPANSKEFVANWDSVFGDRKPELEPPKCDTNAGGCACGDLHVAGLVKP